MCRHPAPGVGVERSFGVPARQDFLEAVDELGKPRRLDRSVLDEGDGFPVPGEAQQQRERRLPQLPHILLVRRIEHPQHRAAASAEPAVEIVELRSHLAAAPARELDQDERAGFSLDEAEPPRILE